ncbi:MAG: bacteriohopanetetrol glucosamine biosynthesis glycosyltransferase HpnI [Verrucomicrobiae bacterium]|nr:bacteriohopanetetrol glucosamine biosynthesis glycosyltransferase HpnI [Verrucomicrobiae bacterium]
MRLEFIFELLLLVSAAIAVWQFCMAFVFPLRKRILSSQSLPNLTILKPLKGTDEFTEDCLKSWLEQDYRGEIQFIFAVDSENDPAFAVCKQLAAKYPHCDISIIACPANHGANSKVSKLVHVSELIKHEIIIVSDADVKVTPNLLSDSVELFENQSVGLVCCLYWLANAENLPMKIEAVAINADFWSQVLQARSLKPMNFALGAVMMIRRKALEQIGGFKAVVNKLADDYWLGRLISEAGWKVDLSPFPVELYHEKCSWKYIWSHQLRWARTIRICEPIPYFLSIISNVTFWAVLSLATTHDLPGLTTIALLVILMRAAMAGALQKRLTEKTLKLWNFYVPILKDLFAFAIWVSAFTGKKVKWRGKTYRVSKDGLMMESKN